MGAGFIHSRNEQTNTIWPLSVLLRVCLGAVGDLVDDAVDGEGAAVGHTGAETLLLHVVGENAGVRCETGDSDAHVRVDFDNLLLI